MANNVETPNILTIPSDVILHIFSFLSPLDIAGGVRRTCKVWYGLSYDKSLWKVIDLNKFELNKKFSSATFLDFLRGISECVQRLDFQRTNFDSEAYLHKDIYCPNLHELNVFGGEIFGDCVVSLLQKYKNLTSVTLTLNSTKTFSDIVKHLGMLENLKKLTLHKCNIDEYSEDMLDELRALYKNLKHLEAVSFVFCDLPVNLYEDIIQNNPNLHELNLILCSELYQDRHEFNIRVDALPQLKKLTLANTNCDDGVLKSFSDKARNLRYVSLSAPQSFITDTGIIYMAERCKLLTTLIISRSRYDKSSVTNVGLETVGKFCPFLRQLVVNHCSEISDMGVTAIARGCTRMEEFEIAGCTALSDTAVLCLVSSCSRLRKLNLNECVQLTCLSINAVIARLKHLRCLSLETCHRLANLDLLSGVRTQGNHVGTISGAEPRQNMDLVGTVDKDDQLMTAKGDISGTVTSHLTAISDGKLDLEYENTESHSHLFRLYLGFCSKISINCIRQIANACPDLREITLQGCSYLNDSSIGVLVRSCRYLKKLNISGGSVNQTSRLTDKSLHYIAIECKNLKQLVICKNHNITIQGILGVISDCPSISLVSVSAGERTNVTTAGLISAVSGIESKLVRIEKFLDTRVDIFVYVNKGSILI